MHKPQISILFVCLGNICRSPLAEAVFAGIVAENGADHRYHVDSAGTGGWHVGNPPDRRSIAVGRSHGVDLAQLRARQVARPDFDRFDLILGMDDANVAALAALAPSKARARIDQFHGFSTGTPRDVPDPYYGGEDGFEQVYRLIRAASGALFARLETGSLGLSG